MSGFRFMGVQEDPEFDTIEARGNVRVYDGTKRDEFACPCCGAPTDSSYCDGCDAFECGEQDVGTADKCLVPDNVRVTRARHAAHYEGKPGKGHDLLVVEVVVPNGVETPYNRRGEPGARPMGLPPEFRYQSGSRDQDGQCWRFVKSVPLSPGKCEECE